MQSENKTLNTKDISMHKPIGKTPKDFESMTKTEKRIKIQLIQNNFEAKTKNGTLTEIENAEYYLYKLIQGVENIEDVFTSEGVDLSVSEPGASIIGQASTYRKRFEGDHQKISQLEHRLMDMYPLAINYIIASKDHFKAQIKYKTAEGKMERKAERNDMWMLWFQKSARWVITTFIAIFLYSSLVWFAKGFNTGEYEFRIAIPIRDSLAEINKN